MEDTVLKFNEQFRIRSRSFAMGICRLMEKLPKNQSLYYLKGQIIRSGTSVAANFRAACRARSSQEYYSKLCIVVEECDETLFWLEFMEETFYLQNEKFKILEKEATELLAVFSTTKRKLKERIKSSS
jgi:four helix bundle protein